MPKHFHFLGDIRTVLVTVRNDEGVKLKLAMKYIILYVNDFEKTMDFYKGKLGLPVKMQWGTEGHWPYVPDPF